jgi:hypothetical protein
MMNEKKEEEEEEEEEEEKCTHLPNELSMNEYNDKQEVRFVCLFVCLFFFFFVLKRLHGKNCVEIMSRQYKSTYASKGL